VHSELGSVSRLGTKMIAPFGKEPPGTALSLCPTLNAGQRVLLFSFLKEDPHAFSREK
jgi:hypothetical protein